MGWGGNRKWGGGGDTMSVIKALLGGGGGGGGGGWGNGKWQQKRSLMSMKTKVAPEKCIWIGGVTGKGGKDTAKKLKAHIESLGHAIKFVEVGKTGGGGFFSSAEEATAAIAALNGTPFEG